MNILSLDLSSKSTGWAVSIDNTLKDYGCITASSADYIERLKKITAEVCDIVKKYNIKKIVCEEVRFGDKNVHTFKVLMYLQAKIVMELHDIDKEIDFEFQQPSEWRKKVGIQTGRGVTREALKPADIKYVKNTYNITVNDDIADAIGILDSVIKPPAAKVTIQSKVEATVVDGFEFK